MISGKDLGSEIANSDHRRLRGILKVDDLNRDFNRDLKVRFGSYEVMFQRIRDHAEKGAIFESSRVLIVTPCSSP